MRQYYLPNGTLFYIILIKILFDHLKTMLPVLEDIHWNPPYQIYSKCFDLLPRYISKSRQSFSGLQITFSMKDLNAKLVIY